MNSVASSAGRCRCKRTRLSARGVPLVGAGDTPCRRGGYPLSARGVSLVGAGGTPCRRGGIPCRRGGIPCRRGGIPCRRGGISASSQSPKTSGGYPLSARGYPLSARSNQLFVSGAGARRLREARLSPRKIAGLTVNTSVEVPSSRASAASFQSVRMA